MKITFSFLIAILLIWHVPECLGDSPYITMIIKGNIQEVNYHDRKYSCIPVENVNIVVFVDEDESTISKNKDVSLFYLTDKKGDFKTIRYNISCDCSSSGISNDLQDKCIPDRIEIIASRKNGSGVLTKRLIYNTADLKITQDKDGVLIFELLVDLTLNDFGQHCGN